MEQAVRTPMHFLRDPCVGCAFAFELDRLHFALAME
jgi:hypothetical protein